MFRTIKKHISIHAPREGCDGHREEMSVTSGQFQSTHPARGATWIGFQSIFTSQISIHAPREGCDSPLFGHSLCQARFQSTHPARGATIDHH